MSALPLRPLAAAALAALLGGSLSLVPGVAQERGPAAGRGAGAEEPQRPAREREPQDEPPPRLAPEPDMTVADRYFDAADYNGDGTISFPEARESLELDQRRYGAYDRFRDGRVTRDEFRAVYAEAVRSVGSFRPPKPRPGAEPLPLEPEGGAETLEPLTPPTSVVELFGQAVPRDLEEEIVPRPPLIEGPVPVFRRLDLDGDGRIARGDLEDLLRPLHVRVRINAVIASLDTDRDGTISQEELRESMQGRRAPVD